MAFGLLNGENSNFGEGVLEVRGEHRLLANILHRALEDATSGKSHPDIRREALSWIFSDSRVVNKAPKGFDFNSLCEYLRLNPDWVRRLVKTNNFSLSSHTSVREVRYKERGPVGVLNH